MIEPLSKNGVLSQSLFFSCCGAKICEKALRAGRETAVEVLCRREKMQSVSEPAGCAEIRKFCKNKKFLHFGEAGESLDVFIFYFQHNKTFSDLTYLLS